MEKLKLDPKWKLPPRPKLKVTGRPPSGHAVSSVRLVSLNICSFHTHSEKNSCLSLENLQNFKLKNYIWMPELCQGFIVCLHK